MDPHVSLCAPQMFLYLSFPVGLFWVSNQAEYFQHHVVQRRREIFPPDNPERVSDPWVTPVTPA
uniref:Uncharacterized protein n=1 Tax=Melopsittacus undulatus TaxID=13146 RepID=A0A8V5H0D5_MELUD